MAQCSLGRVCHFQSGTPFPGSTAPFLVFVVETLDEREQMQELYWFMEELNVDCQFNTHHTSSLYLSGPFLENKERNLAMLRDEMENGDLEELELRRAMKATL